MNHPIKTVSAVLSLILLLSCFCGCSKSGNYVEHFYAGLARDEVKLSREDSRELCELIVNYPLQEMTLEELRAQELYYGGYPYLVVMRYDNSTYEWDFADGCIVRTRMENGTEVEVTYYVTDYGLIKKVREYNNLFD